MIDYWLGDANGGKLSLGENHEVLCPVCGDFYVHIARVRVIQDKTQTIIERSVDRVEELPLSSGRGSTVFIDYFCESGHCFSMQQYFHKGVTFTGMTVSENIPEDRDEWPDELWRD